MTKFNRTLISLVAIAGGLTTAALSHAQLDISRPAPNVLLLVDSSGSMERTTDGSAFPSCDPSGAVPSEKSRWVNLVEVLTGSIQDYRCDAVNRSSAAFRDEYQFFAAVPYDYGYENPYHRPMSGNCVAGPGTVDPTNAFEFRNDGISYHERNLPSVSCDFDQARDGLLDSFQSLVRFGLMTFDTLIDPGTGYQNTTVQAVDGMDGSWSYFLDSNGPQQGRPVGCPTLVDWEVGARNAAAPPWEGRMVAFGDPIADQADRTVRNEQIQQILLATRPYLATPIAGLLSDAKDFLWDDPRADPLDTSKKFGPRDDPYIGGGCRETHIILLTDGEPNLDLRPHCEQVDGTNDGVCPYEKPEEIAHELAQNAPSASKRVLTHVIGFAMSDLTVAASPVDCAALTDDDLNEPGGACATATEADKALNACCTLNRIAYNGGTTRARFANDVTELRRHLMSVFFDLIQATSRTRPVYAPSGPPDPNAAAYRFYSAFTPHPAGWRAKLERQRWVCSSELGTLEARGQDIDPAKGDDFIQNVNASTGEPRTFYTVEGAASAGEILSKRSIRPIADGDDGVGSYGGVVHTGTATNFVDNLDPRAMGTLPTAECSFEGHTAAADCSRYYAAWWVGLDNGSGKHRCPDPGSDCERVGAIYHSTPAVVNRPSELLRDETYDTYASSSEVNRRPLMLYASTTDGFLHGFKVSSNDTSDTAVVDELANNELWAFAPPAVLPNVPTLFANPASRLLDGPPVVREVVAIPRTGTGYAYNLERTPDQARTLDNTWRTILVQGFGSNSGYFAVDVTTPESGPEFLWQLTTDDAGAPLFGATTATPLITTLFVDDGLGHVAEVAVAVLPGGGAVSRGTTIERPPSPASASEIDDAYPLRLKIPSYTAGSSDVRARSLTIVRLDSGEILRTFRQQATEASPSLQAAGVVTEAPLTSPISGEPVAFPGATGAVADRIFVGDADGTLWRVDVSSTHADDWTMKPFFDLHTLDADGSDGQPIVSAPVLSTREDGAVTLLVASGDQETFTPSGTTYVWSLTDTINSYFDGFESKANWFLKFENGERMAGPPSVFSKVAYFATYEPASLSGSNVCSNGTSRVWGMDYVTPLDDGNLSAGGAGRLLADPSNPPDAGDPWPQYLDSTSSSDIPTDAGIFGVTVAMVPSCVATTEVDDSASGSGRHLRITSVTPARYQLLMQTGTSGDSAAGGEINYTSLNLTQPDTATVIDSWAAILE